jgi:hypothetical protein
MQGKKTYQEKLFMNFQLSDRVPADNLYRKIMELVDFNFQYSLQSNFDNSIFSKMVSFAKRKSCSLKGIIDYEVSKQLGKNYFFVPVFYGTTSHAVASADAVLNTNYIKVAEEIRDNSIEYLTSECGISKENIIVERVGRPWYNPIFTLKDGGTISYLYAYKIIFK